MANPKLTITQAGVFDPEDYFVMRQGGQFDIQNDSDVAQTIDFSIAGVSTRTLVVQPNKPLSGINVDFPATTATGSSPTSGAGGSTGVTVKQMSETGTKCGLGFVSNSVIHRIVTNLGNAEIQVRTSNPGANYSFDFLLYTCADGTVAIASNVGTGHLTWSRELGSPEVLKYAADLRLALFFRTSVDGSGQLLLTPDFDPFSNRRLVYHSAHGLCLETSSAPGLGLFVTPAAFPAT